MPSLRTIEDADPAALSGKYPPDSIDLPLLLPPSISVAESTRLVLALVALEGGRPVSEVDLVLTVRLIVDGVVHLWSNEDAPLTATLVMDPENQYAKLDLQFLPIGRDARMATSAAAFLAALQGGAQLGFRGPDGHLLSDRVEVSQDFYIDERLVRFLTLLSDVGRLSRSRLLVPESVDEELVKDLFTAQRLLQGNEVRGTWASGEIRLERQAVPHIEEGLARGSRHELMSVSDMQLELPGATVELGEIRQVFSDAEVEDVRVEGDDIVLRMRAYGGMGKMVLIPTERKVMPMSARLELDGPGFRRLLADLDEPTRHSKLRQIL